MSFKDCTAENHGGLSPASEGPSQAIDGDDDTKWLNFQRKPFIVECPKGVVIDQYTFVTANDETDRDPVRWTLSGKLLNGIASEFPLHNTELAVVFAIVNSEL